MANETQTTIGNDVNWAQFEDKGATGDFLKFKDRETHVIGIKETKQIMGKFMRKQADGTEKETDVPQVGLVLDYVDSPLAKPMLFATSAKYLIATIRKYHENKMLYKWYFEVQRNGVDKATKYTIIPIKERNASPSKQEQVEAFLN